MANFGQRPFMFNIDGYMKVRPVLVTNQPACALLFLCRVLGSAVGGHAKTQEPLPAPVHFFAGTCECRNSPSAPELAPHPSSTHTNIIASHAHPTLHLRCTFHASPVYELPMKRLRLGPRTYYAFSAMARVLTLDLYRQQQQAMVDDEIRLADTSRLVPGLSETDLIQQLVSLARSRRQ